MTPEQMSNEIEEVLTKYGLYLDSKIKEACDKTGWEFFAGMGIWYFSSPKGAKIDIFTPGPGPAIIKSLAFKLMKYGQEEKYFVSNYCKSYRPSNFKA